MPTSIRSHRGTRAREAGYRHRFEGDHRPGEPQIRSSIRTDRGVRQRWHVVALKSDAIPVSLCRGHVEENGGGEAGTEPGSHGSAGVGGRLRQIQDAPQRGWIVVDMKNDWKTIFPKETTNA